MVGSRKARNQKPRNLSLCSVCLISALVVAGVLLFLEFSKPGAAKRVVAEASGYRIVREYPHDPAAFTQGLLYFGNDTLYESTGLYGKSTVREVDLHTGKVKKLHRMQSKHFGEGLTLWKNRLLQVAWLTNEAFIYERDDLKPLGKFTHSMKDGWGLTHDGTHIIGSDGTSTLYFINPDTFKEVRRVSVKFKGQEVKSLNELEYVKGEIWANVWMSECIARISPEDGRVLGWIVLEGLQNSLATAGYPHLDVLNGIAWDSDKDRLFVTGKLWPKIFEIVPTDQKANAKVCVR